MKAANLVNQTDLQLSFYFFFFLNSNIDVTILKSYKTK